MTWTRIVGDANALPLPDQCIDVVIADPPYEGKARRKPRGKKGLTFAATGYIEFSDRRWLLEAFRVLKPTGHLYVVITIRELVHYLSIRPDVVDIISWTAPNTASMAAMWRRGTAGRAPVWRPILHYQGSEAVPLRWQQGYVSGNSIETAMVLSNMHEAMRWPNQLPNKLLKFLLAPHDGIVLDLFSGTGTCAAAAFERGMPVISIDMAHEAIQLGRCRGVTEPMRFDE